MNLVNELKEMGRTFWSYRAAVCLGFFLVAGQSSLRAQVRVAVVGEPEELRQAVEAALSNSPFCQLIDLSKRRDTLRELELAQNGLLDEAKAPRAGRMLGVEKWLIVQGKGGYRSLRLVDAETSTVEGAWVEEVSIHAQLVSVNGYAKLINKMLEGLAVKRFLAEMKSSEKNIQVRISMKSEKLKFGDPFSFAVLSSQDGYLTIIDIQPDGSILQLLPNSSGASNKIVEDEPFVFPPRGIELTVSPPGGVDTLRAIVTRKPLQLFPQADLDSEAIPGVKPGAGLRAGRGLRMRILALQPDEWGMAEARFRTEE